MRTATSRVKAIDKGIATQNGLVSFWHKALLIPRIAAPIPLAAAQRVDINPKDISLIFLLFKICRMFSRIVSYESWGNKNARYSRMFSLENGMYPIRVIIKIRKGNRESRK